MRRGGMQQDVHKVRNLFQLKFVFTYSSSPFKNAKFYAVADVHSKISTRAPFLGPIFFIFMQFTMKSCQIIGWHPHYGIGAPRLGNLDPPLVIFTVRKRSFGQGDVFTPVCHSVHRGRGAILSKWGAILKGGAMKWGGVP